MTSMSPPPRLGVGGRDRERAFLIVAELLRDFLDRLDRAQDLARLRENDLAGWRDPCQMLAAALEDLDAQLILEQADLMATVRMAICSIPDSRITSILPAACAALTRSRFFCLARSNALPR